MSEMVERVARALFLAEHPGSEWSAGRARYKWFALAEAALEAMREPTEEMLWAADNQEPNATWWPDEPGERNTAAETYRAMIDAALETPAAPSSRDTPEPAR